MTLYNCIPDFTGLILAMPDKSDVERDAVAKVWEEHGGKVIKVGRFWEPPELLRETVRLYGNHIFRMVLAQKLNLKLLSPADDFLMNLSPKWLKRTVGLSNLLEAQHIIYPCFIKPLAPKVFAARKYKLYTELLDECNQLQDSTPIVYSDIVEISAEVRSFILNGKVIGTSIYEGDADINSAKLFLMGFLSENFDHIPSACVIDIGFINDSGWTIIEANASWGAGLNGCDPLSAAMCIAEATKPEEV